MKLGKLNILTAVVFSSLAALTSCSKDDGAIPERVGIEDVPVITTNLVKNNGTADTIFLASQDSYQGQVKIAMYFPSQAAPTKVDVVIRKNGAAGNVKLFQADVKSFPTTVTVTAAQLATLFGQPLVSADKYEVGPDIYVGTTKYEAFPAAGLGNGQGVTGMIGFGAFVTILIRP